VRLTSWSVRRPRSCCATASTTCRCAASRSARPTATGSSSSGRSRSRARRTSQDSAWVRGLRRERPHARSADPQARTGAQPEGSRVLNAELSQSSLRLRGANAALTEAERRLRALVEQQPLVTYIDGLGEDQTTEFVSANILELTDTPGTVVSRAELLLLRHTSRRPARRAPRPRGGHTQRRALQGRVPPHPGGRRHGLGAGRGQVVLDDEGRALYASATCSTSPSAARPNSGCARPERGLRPSSRASRRAFCSRTRTATSR